MQSALDQAITDTAAAEATYIADSANVEVIKNAITTATAPLAPAEQLLSTDKADYKAKLITLAQVATDTANAL